jgi:hypothetical protein
MSHVDGIDDGVDSVISNATFIAINMCIELEGSTLNLTPTNKPLVSITEIVFVPVWLTYTSLIDESTIIKLAAWKSSVGLMEPNYIDA